MAVNLEFNNKLSEMADNLIGNIQPSEYKNYVLGLIFSQHNSGLGDTKISAKIVHK